MNKVLLTGAFGNIGKNTLIELLKSNYKVRCFDLKTSINKKEQRKLKRLAKRKGWEKFETVWGDIRNSKHVKKIVKDIDTIIHLAAIIPPLAYKNKDLAYSVNVEGTSILINEAEKQHRKPHFIYASSVAVHGNRMKYAPPLKINDPLAPLDYDNYAKHKILMEKKLKTSTLQWTILRFGVVTPFEMSWEIPSIMYEIPLTQRIELVDPRDVGLACANAVKNTKAKEKTLFIGGGEGNQVYQRDYIKQMLNGMGIGMLPEIAFKPVEKNEDYFHCDWMDTNEAEKILHFQKHDFDDFLDEFKKRRWFMRLLATIFRPIVKKYLLDKSPYYKKRIKKQIKQRRLGKTPSPVS